MIHIDRKDKAYFFTSPYFPGNMRYTLLSRGAKALIETALKAAVVVMVAGVILLLIFASTGHRLGIPMTIFCLGALLGVAFVQFYAKEIPRRGYFSEEDGAFKPLLDRLQEFLNDEEVAHLFTERPADMSDIDHDYANRINSIIASFLLNTKGLSKHTDRRSLDELEQALNRCYKSVCDLIDKRSKAVEEGKKCRQEKSRIQRNYDERRSRDFDEEN